MLACVWSQGARFIKGGHSIADIVVGVWFTAGASEWVSGYLHVPTAPARRGVQAARREYKTTDHQIAYATWLWSLLHLL
jgi:hypothetical protein